jgi:hypothetical protein
MMWVGVGFGCIIEFLGQALNHVPGLWTYQFMVGIERDILRYLVPGLGRAKFVGWNEFRSEELLTILEHVRETQDYLWLLGPWYDMLRRKEFKEIWSKRELRIMMKQLLFPGEPEHRWVDQRNINPRASSSSSSSKKK